MPEPLAQHVEHTAKLELADGTRLVGDISVLPDDSLQLTAARVLRKSVSGQQPAMHTGDKARLVMAGSGAGSRSGVDSPVTLEKIAGDTLTLRFTDPGDESAKQIQASLAGHARPTESAATLARYPVILETLERESLERMEKLLKPFLKDLADYLFDLSTQVRQSSTDQNIFYDATVAIRRNSGALAADIVKRLAGLYRDPTPAKIADEPQTRGAEEGSDLNLVDTAEFESSLALERMASHGEDIYRVPLEALLIRYATLLDEDPHRVRLPVHVRPLCKALQQRALLLPPVRARVLVLPLPVSRRFPLLLSLLGPQIERRCAQSVQ